MNLLQYQRLAQQTKSPEFFAERVYEHSLYLRVRGAIHALQLVDEVKKALFYGKPFSGQIKKSDQVIEHMHDCHLLPLSILHPDSPQAAVDIIHGVLGIATEAGELLELLMTSLTKNQPLDHTKLMLELGDGSLWYTAITLDAICCTFERCAEANIKKLNDKGRFKNGFSIAEALNRNEDKEEQAATESTKPGVVQSDGSARTESDGEMLQRLGTDADLWARECAKRFYQQPPHQLDIDFLRAWFANAIERAKDEKRWEIQEKISELVKIQSSPGNGDVNEYMRGMANGLICALSVITGSSPEYLTPDFVKQPKEAEPNGTAATMIADAKGEING